MKYFLPLLALLLTACGDAVTSADNASPPEATTVPAPPVTQPNTAPVRQAQGPPAPAPTMAPLAAGDLLYPWVDGVNVRERPSTTGKRVARVLENEAVTYAGEASKTEESVLLRGVEYREPWYKVTTRDDVTGWIFGGTVRREGEKKGNAAPSAIKLAYPYFGTYDLATWEQLPNVANSGGDATSVIQTYRQDGKEMTIDRTDLGDYGYTHTFTLRDPDGDVMLERNLRYSTDGGRMLTETVVNRMGDTPVEYSRSQKIQGAYYSFDDGPDRVNGAWTSRSLD